MRNGMAVVLAAAVAAAACNRMPVSTAGMPTMATTSGDVSMNASGTWVDMPGGIWMDTSGTIWTRERGRSLDLGANDLSALTNANVAAHLAAGDSLEVELSRSGAMRAQNPDVQAFAQRMAAEHAAHLTLAKQSTEAAGVLPVTFPADTMDAPMVRMMIQRLASTTPGMAYDRQLMRDEVMMHQHMLHDLTTLRGHADGAMRQLVVQTIPVVEHHLADAQAIRMRLGDSRGMGRPSSR